MALLTAEDVLNKAFSKTKYREGFDQDEVDDFLDEVAHTIQSLIAERDDLAQRLAQAQAGAPSTPSDEPAEVPSTEGGLLAAATDPTPPSATGMLAMAQKLHDEYVQAGESERDRLVEEGKAKAESIVEQAETDAKDRMDQLNSERTELEAKIEDLRRFERDYRARLKSYLENLLGDLDHGASSEAQSSLSAAPAFDGGFGQAEPAAEADGYAASEVSVPSIEEPSAASVAREDDAAPQAAASPWAQVRPQEPSVETPSAWGAPVQQPTSDVAQEFGAEGTEGEQR
ncbi:DivIVA domain-containing protein [Demequina sp.]|uniref:DivIVA domain-containing protein n=1 Tax=Demequina sp. TaxID=2050685 RepID=UPI003A8BA984